MLGQHRECCALRGRGWGRNHSVVNYVFTYTPDPLVAYHFKVMDEMKKRGYHPDEIWYFTDNRQSLYFEQVFRASYKSKLVPDSCKLLHFGFGTINGSDGKPYKTRDGGVMELGSLIEIIKAEIEPKLKTDLENKKEISEKLTIATLKYADLMSHRATDYIFDPIKFSSFELSLSK